MVAWLPNILPLLIGVAGWYYLFYSRAAHHLGTLEGDLANQRRVLLRRANGVALILLAVLLYVGVSAINAPKWPILFLLDWFGVLLLLLTIVLLALIDIRQTISLRRKRDGKPKD